ncbi:TetR/AcrR family transcriptional regulator [Streptomyces sp. NPDC058469]|uniref:TetR/AcrR family transcriptional regulator n=1 Tax=Streptomyces sp. NPDC058469 TaxID=3346514 RepID=UPI00364F3929
MTEATTGRRERKKAHTRTVIADAALELFLERGYDGVTVKDVAEAADLSMSGLFKHFPTKESLVFDMDDDIRTGLVGAVRERPDGTAPLDALGTWLRERALQEPADSRREAFQRLVSSSPALREYARRMWLSHEEQLAAALADAGPDAPDAAITARALARFVLDRGAAPDRAHEQRTRDAAITLLADGWPAPELQRASTTTPAPAADPTPARPPGLRERKKAETRQAISNAAFDLFTERGYDNVGVREIAEAAGTSIGTLFSYFPEGKSSLLFTGDRAGHIAALVDAVEHRPPGYTIPRALGERIAMRGPFKQHLAPGRRRTVALIDATPELSEHARRTWAAAEGPLTTVISEQTGLPHGDPSVRLLARYILQAPDLARTSPDPRHALEAIIRLLERGWPACLTHARPA